MAEPKSKKRKVTCLGDDCNAEFELDEDGEGSCPECGLNMGAILNRFRHEKAMQKLRESGNPNPKKKKLPFTDF